jgi:hypothetical protein
MFHHRINAVLTENRKGDITMWRGAAIKPLKRCSMIPVVLSVVSSVTLTNTVRSLHLSKQLPAPIKESRRYPRASAPPSSDLCTSSSELFDDMLNACDSLTDICSSARHMGQSGEAVVFSEFVRAIRSAMCLSATQLRLTPSNMDILLLVLAALSGASEVLVQRRQAYYRSTTSFLDTKLDQSQVDVTSSPYFSGEALDFVSAIGAFCLHCILASPAFLISKNGSSQRHGCTNDDVARLYETLQCCVQLEVCDPASLTAACRVLTSKAACSVMSSADLVDVLHVVTLCHKRRRIVVPNLDPLLLRMQSAKDLDSRKLLLALSSLARVHRGGPQNGETSKILSRRLGEKFRNSFDHPAGSGALSADRSLVSQAEEFTNKDIVFALQTATLSEVATSFITVALEICAYRASTFSAEELGNVCKYLKQIHLSNSRGHITRSTCGRETRRLIPQLLTRTNELLGTFSLRDARHVLECLDAFQQRHSVIFSQLTPFVSGSGRH